MTRRKRHCRGISLGLYPHSDGDDATIVTEVFDFTRVSHDLLHEGGTWINGSNSVLESMAGSLEKLEKISTE